MSHANMAGSSLPRAVIYALVCVMALGVAAFWPATHDGTPSRPALKAPIVFDELQNLPPPSADPGAAARSP